MNIFTELLDAIVGIWNDSGFISNGWQNYVMIVVACVLFYLAIKKQFEPLLLLPIAFGMLMVNLFPAIMAAPQTELVQVTKSVAENSSYAVVNLGDTWYEMHPTNGGLFYYLYQGVKLGIYPPLIFLGDDGDLCPKGEEHPGPAQSNFPAAHNHSFFPLQVKKQGKTVC